ncbi:MULTISPECIES: pyridoxal phosphate-dependent aminotransferase [Xanthomonas]|uniref:pyridoxal phosphate-dependent aminotransferase n=1 Tax=Xanthomonas TaxID=338 RepID=UPI0005AF1972|nr:pyridoxal phosphate-dependent aminotransferase [Xanthomonas campestris]KIQ26262.1 aminotransferase [Xanthomonas campestris]MCC5092213.1 pyridoxal phosphate-dependent aminotransferase [Xanthomonas campestris pv. incanae]MEA9609863.1 pyridoxal phosphate-dependent aminotransferase [Xanthomonas campestris pv. incanae]MEA9619690.1 pyridoxal phosphate-dependent aminotransferase [Xanthomonas campestris pv. incanae]MEA9749227.1 pyridoxal phosphate-dependent aminotransferase [Xanthomonas campestris 
MSTAPQKPLAIRERLSEVRYEIRGELARRARELEAQGRKLIKLNIGNPGAFGFRAPEHLQRAIADDMGRTDPYTHQQGLPEAREAIAAAYARRQHPDAHPDRIFIGNGVSELIDLSLRALLNPGDEVLVPSPDYPLWSAATILNDGRPVYYRCAPENGFQPDPVEIETLVSSRTRAIVLINPNNPSGASYSRELLERIVAIAVKHNLLLMVDEIYDQVLYDGAAFVPVAPLAGEHPCITFSGLSKVHRACGWRVGWALLSGEQSRINDLRNAMDLLGALRLCANVPGQYAIDAAVNGPDTISALCAPGGRLYETRRAVIEACAASSHLSLVAPAGALYAFPAVVGPAARNFDDHTFALDLMNDEGVLVVPGSSFNVPYRHHFRVTLMPEAAVMRDVFARIDRALTRRAEAVTKVVPLKSRSVA